MAAGVINPSVSTTTPYVRAWQVEVSGSEEEQMGLRVDAAQEVMMTPASD